MMARKFVRKSARKRKFLLFSLLLCISMIGIGFASIGTNLGIGGALSFLGYKPLLTITLNNQSATTPGTTVIYEKLSRGFYLDNSLQNQMTTSTNGIIIPVKTGYIFEGYYTGTNGSGTQYIDSTGQLTSSANNTHFIINGSLYAKWTRIMAESIGYSNENINSNQDDDIDCTDVQCMIDTIYNMLNS